jgi:hypothetical protein
MNPCPCGWYGDTQHECTCSPSVVSRYQKRLSGPLLDRTPALRAGASVDIHVEVLRVDFEKLSDCAASRRPAGPEWTRGGARPPRRSVPGWRPRASGSAGASPARQATLAALGARYAPFEAVTDSGKITFMGTGDRTATPEEHLWLASWAQTVVMEAASGVSMATLEWDLGPTDDIETTCMHLAVLTRGEAYAETRPCAGGDARDIMIGWLEAAELEQLITWLRDFAPLTAENGYVAGTGAQPSGAEELAVVEQWAAAVWLRLWDVETPSQIGASTGQPAGCPDPADGAQLYVNTDDGYCVLYPAGYVAEQTAPGGA